jgi:hypothetical protein
MSMINPSIVMSMQLGKTFLYGINKKLVGIQILSLCHLSSSHLHSCYFASSYGG